MSSFSPQQIALLIVVVTAVVGLVVMIVRRRAMFAEFEGIAQEVPQLAKSMGGELQREAGDLLIVGDYKKLPVSVRFSNDDYMPGLTVTAQVPATFTLYVASGSTRAAGGGRSLIRTGDRLFDSRFNLTSDHPVEAKLFLTPHSLAAIRRLVCSTETRLKLTKGELVITEAAVPSDMARHVLAHLKEIQDLAADLAQMPGAHEVKVPALKRNHHLVTRSVIGVGAVVALVMLVAGGTPQQSQPPASAQDPSGVLPIDARLISDLRGWRVATPDDFDPSVLNWMKNNDIVPLGRMPGDFSGKDNPADVAYLLVSPNGVRRLVVLSEGKLKYDAKFDSLLGVILLPKLDIDSIDWPGGKQPGQVDGDGLILVRRSSDPSADVVFFCRNGAPYFAKPLKYDNITTQR
jgi:hypothetical protein